MKENSLSLEIPVLNTIKNAYISAVISFSIYFSVIFLCFYVYTKPLIKNEKYYLVIIIGGMIFLIMIKILELTNIQQFKITKDGIVPPLKKTKYYNNFIPFNDIEKISIDNKNYVLHYKGIKIPIERSLIQDEYKFIQLLQNINMRIEILVNDNKILL
ncbi:MAG: hypothetical protein QXH42_10020 [Thermoplasmata archaeon]